MWNCGLAKPGFCVDLSLPNAKIVETGFLATYAWGMKLSEVLLEDTLKLMAPKDATANDRSWGSPSG
ncbi:hypothetical protein AVDCRST_MAG84-125 [uncultured Microcoleus sp.]|uniref:Uncharacterized protein n=1 Tax=uncultured Microcoleus sp. TaxID=259945 RepID=A0A6J4KCV7_9CYAN|nr:hypothetical protein AVDCRST_MAG84-125 [uncultured Microcoleus sp.]